MKWLVLLSSPEFRYQFRQSRSLYSVQQNPMKQPCCCSNRPKCCKKLKIQCSPSEETKTSARLTGQMITSVRVVDHVSASLRSPLRRSSFDELSAFDMDSESTTCDTSLLAMAWAAQAGERGIV